jgi:uncharacterized phage protein gp47/JayE
MPNTLDANGLQIKESSEILEALKTGDATTPGFKQIYGDDTNFDTDTPDGNMLQNLTLQIRDPLELMLQIYTAKDPDQAIGQDLDAVAQYAGLTRQAGTYTAVTVEVTADRSVTLYGLDDADNEPFTVSDDEGNKFNLIATSNLSSGSNSLAFQAEEIGAIQVLANTLTNIDTPNLGITSVNNAAAGTTGVDEQSDSDFRILRQKSISAPGQAMIENLRSGLAAVSGIVESKVYENNTGSTVGVIPASSIWVIADGGATADIAEVIYKYRSLGCGMHGVVTSSITQSDGTTFIVGFDRAVSERLYLNLTVSHLTGTLDDAALKNYINANYLPTIYKTANSSDIITLINEYDSNIVVSVCEVSINNSDFYPSLAPSSQKNKFAVAVADITVTEV